MNRFQRFIRKQKYGYGLDDVKTGDNIIIEWKKIVAGSGTVECLNNDPKGRKMWVKIRWSNYEKAGVDEYQRIIFDYGSYVFDNFYVLNPEFGKKMKSGKELVKQASLEELETALKTAVEGEHYEEARIIQKQIDKVKKTKS